MHSRGGVQGLSLLVENGVECLLSSQLLLLSLFMEHSHVELHHGDVVATGLWVRNVPDVDTLFYWSPSLSLGRKARTSELGLVLSARSIAMRKLE